MAVDLPAFDRPAKATSRSPSSGRQWMSLTVVAKRAWKSLDMCAGYCKITENSGSNGGRR